MLSDIEKSSNVIQLFNLWIFYCCIVLNVDLNLIWSRNVDFRIIIIAHDV